MEEYIDLPLKTKRPTLFEFSNFLITFFLVLSIPILIACFAQNDIEAFVEVFVSAVLCYIISRSSILSYSGRERLYFGKKYLRYEVKWRFFKIVKKVLWSDIQQAKLLDYSKGNELIGDEVYSDYFIQVDCKRKKKLLFGHYLNKEEASILVDKMNVYINK